THRIFVLLLSSGSHTLSRCAGPTSFIGKPEVADTSSHLPTGDSCCQTLGHDGKDSLMRGARAPLTRLTLLSLTKSKRIPHELLLCSPACEFWLLVARGSSAVR